MPYARSVRPPAACSPTTTPRRATGRARRPRGGARPRAGAPRQGDRTWNFASRLDDVAALEAALSADPDDATAAALLGHWCYAHDRPDDAVALLAPLGRARSRRSGGLAQPGRRRVQPRARSGGGDGRVRTGPRRSSPATPSCVFERDQLLKRIGAATAHRLDRLEQRPGADHGPRRPGRGVLPPAARPPIARPTRSACSPDGASSPGRAARARCCGPGNEPSSRSPTRRSTTRTTPTRGRPRPSRHRPVRPRSVRPGIRWPTRRALLLALGDAVRRRRRSPKAARQAWQAGGRRGRRLRRHEPAGVLGEHLLLGARRPPAGRVRLRRPARRRADRATPSSWPDDRGHDRLLRHLAAVAAAVRRRPAAPPGPPGRAPAGPSWRCWPATPTPPDAGWTPSWSPTRATSWLSTSSTTSNRAGACHDLPTRAHPGPPAAATDHHPVGLLLVRPHRPGRALRGSRPRLRRGGRARLQHDPDLRHAVPALRQRAGHHGAAAGAARRRLRQPGPLVRRGRADRDRRPGPAAGPVRGGPAARLLRDRVVVGVPAELVLRRRPGLVRRLDGRSTPRTGPRRRPSRWPT